MVEGVKDVSFLVMVVELAAIMFNDLDFVLMMYLVCTCMKEAGVFITF